MASTRTVAAIVDHYLSQHRQGRTLDTIAAILKRRTGSGSDTSLSAWRNGHQVPDIKQVKELRKIVECQCFEFGDEAISIAYGTAATAAAAASDSRYPGHSRRSAKNPVHIPPAIPAIRQWPPKHIVGRTDQVQEFAELQAGRTTHQVTNIFGPGGIGKTEVFLKFVTFGQQRNSALGYADIAEIKYPGYARPLTAVDILRALAATIERPELEPFHRYLRDHDLATAAVQTAGHISNLFGLNGRPYDEATLPRASDGASPQLLELLRSRFAFERYLRQAPNALTAAFCEGLGAITEAGGKTALLLDTYEEIGGLDDWICREVVPALPEHTSMVILGRHQLTKRNIDWLDHQHTLHTQPLPELSEDEAKSYLRHYGVTESAALDGVYAVTGGYPLLLVLARALAAESGGWEPIGELKHDRDRDTIARGLLERILREDRAKTLREVLETCSVAPWIDPEIIEVLLGVPEHEARTLYDELYTHSLATRHPRGVVLHDKIRELLQVRIKFAGETRYEELQSRLATYLARKGGVSNE